MFISIDFWWKSNILNKSGVKDLSINTYQDSSDGSVQDCKHKNWTPDKTINLNLKHHIHIFQTGVFHLTYLVDTIYLKIVDYLRSYLDHVDNTDKLNYYLS